MKTRFPVNSIVLFLLIVMLFSICEAYSAQEKRISIVAFSKKRFWGLNVNDAKIALEMWTKVLSRKNYQDFLVKSVICDDVSDIIRDVQEGKVDFASIEAIEYLQLKDRGILEPLLVSERHGKIFEEYVLLVNADSDIRELSQLRGKKILIDSGGKGEIGRMWLDTLLLKKGLPATKKLFGAMTEVKEASGAIFPVFFKKQDACLVTSDSLATMEELNPRIGKKLKVLAKSSGFLINVLFYRKGCPEHIRKAMLDTALILDRDTDGQQVLLMFRIDRLVAYKPTYLDSVKELCREYQLLKKGK